MGADFAAWTGGSGILVTAILGAASSVVSQIIYIEMTVKNVDAKYFLKPDVAGELLFDAAVGATFNVCGSAWAESLKYGRTPSVQAKFLQKVLSFCHTDLNEIEDSIVVNRVLGLRQTLIDAVYEYLKKTGDKLIKYKRCLGTEILAWIAFFTFLVVSVYIGRNWNIFEFIVLFCILELPMIYIFPLGCQTVKFDEKKVSTGWWFIKFRTFLWSEVCDVIAGV
ncbi:hypothetical protein CAFE_32760 [Caprobacter fermentans]|uniref:Uncharacterized protein n=2 Tax=Caproicibacter fermentans TaxID=2576756 RepID=A0A6N8I309_9FIRM|nr:hypothetical protein [Caproicibacter fermentans]